MRSVYPHILPRGRYGECPSCGQQVWISTTGSRPYYATHNLIAPSKPDHLKPECSASRSFVNG